MGLLGQEGKHNEKEVGTHFLGGFGGTEVGAAGGEGSAGESKQPRGSRRQTELIIASAGAGAPRCWSRGWTEWPRRVCSEQQGWIYFTPRTLLLPWKWVRELLGILGSSGVGMGHVPSWVCTLLPPDPGPLHQQRPRSSAGAWQDSARWAGEAAGFPPGQGGGVWGTERGQLGCGSAQRPHRGDGLVPPASLYSNTHREPTWGALGEGFPCVYLIF